MKTLTLICLFSLSTLFGYAQKPGDGTIPMNEMLSFSQSSADREAFKKKIQTHKIAYFTEEMSFTPAEAEKFWPLYNTFFEEREKLFRESAQKTLIRGKDHKTRFDVSNLSDAEIAQLLENKEKIIDLEKQFHKDLCKLLPPKRVLLFYNVERDFQRELVSSRGSERRRETKHVGRTDFRRNAKNDIKDAVNVSIWSNDTIYKVVDNCDDLRVTTLHLLDRIMDARPLNGETDTLYLDIRTSDGQVIRWKKKVKCDSTN